MTELQMGLLGLGGVAVVGVLLYNKWQERKHRRVVERMLPARNADALFVEPADPLVAGADEAMVATAPTAQASRSFERIEPVLAAEPMDDAPSVSFDVLDNEPEHPADQVFGQQSTSTSDLLSPSIDYIASLDSVEPVSAQRILTGQNAALARIAKPIHWFGYNERTQEWESMTAHVDSEYRRVRVGLQLVDRRGPVTESELSTFHIALQDLADELMAIVELPSRQAALETAVALDAFCAGVDIQIGINVIAQGQSFPGTKLRALVESAGMVLDVEGRFVRCDAEGHVLYVLSNQGADAFSNESMRTLSTQGLTFLLDVPRVLHGERTFNQMLELARRFAEALQGALVDDNRRPLSEEALEPIRRQVAQYQAMMAANKLPAGGSLAQRLFS